MPRLHVVFDRRGAVINYEAKILSIEYTRTLDEVSTATITLANQGTDCCKFVDDLFYLDTVSIFVDEGMQWYGWITNITSDETAGTVQIEAVDALWWMGVRVIRTDQLFTNTDLSMIYAAYYADAIEIDNPGIALRTYATGILADRTVLAADTILMSDAVADLLTTGLDITAVGQTIYAGELDFGTITLTSRDFNAKPILSKSVDSFGNAFYLRGDNDIISTCSAISDFPLVERVLDLSDITSQSELDNAATNYCENSNIAQVFVETPDGGNLTNCDDIDRLDLVAGLRVIFDATDLCGGFVAEHKLQTVTFNHTPGVSSVSVQLAPMGESFT